MHHRKLQPAPPPSCSVVPIAPQRLLLGRAAPPAVAGRAARRGPARPGRSAPALPPAARHPGADHRRRRRQAARPSGAGRRLRGFRAGRKKLSAERDGSDLARIAREAHLAPVAVDDWTFEVLEKSCALARESQGALDPAVGGRLAALASCRRWRERRRPIRTPRSKTSISAAAGWAPVVRCGSTSPASPKASRSTARSMRCAPPASPRAWSRAGGDLKVFGELAVAVGVRHPAEPQQIAVALELQDGAIATTGSYDRQHRSCGRTVCQLIRPGTASRWPPSKRSACWPQAPSMPPP